MPTPSPLYPLSDLRRIESTALAALPPGTLMQRAASAAARHALQILGGQAREARVLALAGPGNNGGDAMLSALELRRAGVQASVMLVAPDATRPDDAQRALALVRSEQLALLPATADTILKGGWDLVLDGLFGIGLSRAIDGVQAALVDAVNALACPVLAIDIPSGLDTDTGMPVGGGAVVRATHTCTFIADKPGLHTGQGRDQVGALLVDSLAIDPSHFSPSSLHLNTTAMFTGFLRRRPHYSHKGSYGDVTLVGGAPGMYGALVLAARSALHCGAGRVFAAFLGDAPAYDSMQPELMCRRAADVDLASGVVVIGPGLGMSERARLQLQAAIDAGAPLLIDADGLNLLASAPALHVALRRRAKRAVLTPHPLEAARLLGCTVAEVQADRVASARRLAHEFNAVVVLKGSGSVIADADGKAAINPTGNPALATGGTGDVLAGACGALLAQAYDGWQSALVATWLHGEAAERLVAEGTGPIGFTAGELIPSMRALLNRLVDRR